MVRYLCVREEVYPAKTEGKRTWWDLNYWFYTSYTSQTLRQEVEQLRKDFEELDKKFDLLERYLQIELVKTKEEVQTYDWATKNESETFRKTHSYEKIKQQKDKLEE